ncbi:MAG: GTP cyclohydrolase II [Myxococcales bacterium]|nr:GTP cyclohydrolase II [Myxococcales bacterium]
MADKSALPELERYAETLLPTEYGRFRTLVYREAGSEFEHLAIVSGEIRDQHEVLVRVHSACLTGEVLHSLKCDCREQLALAMERIDAAGTGVVIYLQQEGRGIGLGNKIRAYAKQEQGLDTVDANRAIGFEDDLRHYGVATAILADLGVRSVQLMTNNPAKVEALRTDGVLVTRRVGHVVAPHELNVDYLLTKRARMGHLYDSANGGNGGLDSPPSERAQAERAQAERLQAERLQPADAE